MLRFTSALQREYSDALEQLMFFNPGQQSALAAIVDSVEMFGTPSVYADGDRLRVKVAKLQDVQTLFALAENSLVGVLVYSRVDASCLAVIHLAVDQDYSTRGRFAEQMLVMRMLQVLRSSARRIKGIETVRMLYGGNRVRDFSV